MQIQKTNNQTSFGFKNINIGDISFYGDKTVKAFQDAIPEIRKMGGKNTELIIDDWANHRPVRVGMYAIVKPYEEPTLARKIINFLTGKKTNGFAKGLPPHNKDEAIKMAKDALDDYITKNPTN